MVMELNDEERMVLALLHEAPVRNPAPKGFDEEALVAPLDVTIDKLLHLGYLEIGELPPRSGEHWYFHTPKAWK
jgi:hypothetical protein